ncbi:MAG: endonuclease III [Desulfobulbaceae bacterium]|nr:endonuclease III [Candidatus Kapabacteria bacterium]MBS3999747.1 endonuclease III [Desulfobulbaceae bacterium]
MSDKKFQTSLSAKKERIADVISILSQKYPDVKIQLDHENPFELLIATILSAQCTDARVNIVTKDLFAKYKIPTDYLIVEVAELEQDIFSTGFYKAKAKNIRGACRMIIDDFGGEVPQTMENLLKLPGVGRKTANVILGHCFDTPGIVVDTHVIRISNKLALVSTTDAVKIENELMKLIPKELWVIFTHYFINHGRNTCIARRPKCSICEINHLCPSAQI